MRRYWLFWIAMLAGGLVFTVGLMEGALRVYTTVDQQFGRGLKGFDPMAVQIEPHGVLGYRQRPNSVLHYRDGIVATSNSLGYRGPEVPRQPEPGTVRIILLGGSTTHGYGVSDDETIDAYMRSILHERFPARRFEVVNLALDGYDSYQMLQRLQSDGLPMHPTVVVLNEGINDVRSAWFPNLKDADPRSMLWLADLERLRAEHARGGPTLWARTKHYLMVARLPGYLREQLGRRIEAQQRAKNTSVATATSGAGASTDSAAPHPPYPEAVEFFDRHFREMVALSLGAGSAVLLSTPPSALPTYAPTATSTQNYWVIDAKITQEYRDRLAARLQAIERDERAKGHPVRYVRPVVPTPLFLDDCHLKPDGNRVVASAFVDAIIPMLQNVAASGAPGQRAPGQ
jgi:lysophospholipase L1-like esterase